MPAVSVFGAQWGDEGKGKIIDLLARDADIVARYQGGANAGHTVVVGGETYVLHLLPSGILHNNARNLVTAGVVVDPFQLLREIDELADRGLEVTPERLGVSPAAHVLLEVHRTLDRAAEGARGRGRIGTTGRGIGPCYADKASRVGLRVGDLLSPARLRTRLSALLEEKNLRLERVYGEPPVDLDGELDRLQGVAERLAPFVGDTGAELRRAHAEGRRILFEGAQGALLDLDHGTYPYVTSSNTGADGIPAGAGFPPRAIDRVIAIAKAYCTRVGEGPFPTEDTGELGETLRRQGNEFGATTGRPRRCGWFDAPAVRYALELSGADGLVLTNLDVLSSFESIPLGVAYEEGGRELEGFPADLCNHPQVRVRYEKLPGWRTDITGVRSYEELPAPARAYVERIEQAVGVPVEMLSVGPEREQVITRGG